MTLYELQEKLSEQINLLSDRTTSYAKRKEVAEIAMVVSSLAKQMINNADVVLRTEKLSAEGKIKNSTIEKMVGHGEM